MRDVISIDSFAGDKWDPLDEMRIELRARWLCAQLYGLLIPGLLSKTDVRQALEEGMTWLRDAPDHALARLGPVMWQQQEQLLAILIEYAKPSISWTRLGDDFRWLCRERKDLKERGIPAGWIARRFHLPAFDVEESSLWHMRVGVATHAGRLSLDEMHVLSDMFYFLEQARANQQLLNVARDNDERTRAITDWYEVITRVKANICGCARQAVLASCSFVEAFTNGLGTDHAVTHPHLPPTTREFLNGRQKGRWLSLSRRLEGYPQVIQGAGDPLFHVCDREQRQEPFKSFFETAVDTRDGTMHPAEGKATIWRGPQEWVDCAQTAVHSALAVSRLMWSSCRPGMKMPAILWNLDESELSQHARRRVGAESVLTERLKSVGVTADAARQTGDPA